MPPTESPAEPPAESPTMGDPATALRQFDARIAALCRPGAVAGFDGAAQRLDTHISALLLAGDRVFKFMRPVHFGFVDFSALATRRAACAEELRLNRRTAPDHYLGAAALRQAADGPVLAPWRPGDGEAGVLDWAVEMRRFDDSQRFDRLAARGGLGSAHIDALAAALVAFHAAQPPSPPDIAQAHPDSIRRWARDNLAELHPMPAAQTHGDTLRALAAWTEARGDALLPVMRARAGTGSDGGHVRECHGDLHLANIVWLPADAQAAPPSPGTPLLFDALEFAATLRHTDTASDLSFVFMDLLARGLPRLAWRFVNAVLEASGDHAVLPLLPWWTVYRALVRAKVALLSGGDGAADRAAALVALAARTAGLPDRPPPRLVMTCGLSGSGKTTVAGHLAERLGALRVRADIERKRLFGLAPTAQAPDALGVYTPAATQRTYRRLADVAALALGAGLSAVVDAASLKRSERDALRALAALHGAAFTLLVCTAPAEVLAVRIGQRAAEGRDASDATVAVMHQQQHWVEWPGADEAGDTLWLDTAAAADVVADRVDHLPLPN